MSGMLNQGMGVMGSMDTGGMDPQALMQMMQMRQKDPFSRGMPGEGLMGAGGLSPASQPPSQAPAQLPGLADTQMGNPQQFSGAPEAPGMSTISTDFANTQPGLPNLPDSFLGFGYGQFAPKEVQTGPGMQGGMQGGMRQQMIMQMLQQLLPQMMGQGGGQGAMGGMGDPNMMGGGF